jgi:glycosyltransferase involved in cell wall biosynthesis
MKRIIIFSLAYYPNNVSGAEAAIKEITDRIDPNDIEFHMVTLRYNSALPKVEKIGNVLIHRIGLTTKNPTFEDLSKLPLDLNKPLYQFLAPLKASFLHRRYKYDAVWAMMAHSAGVPAVIFKITHPKAKFVLTLQEGDPTDYIEKVMRPLWPLFSRAFTKADVVQPISKYLADWARRRGVEENRIKLIHNGANPKNLNPTFSRTEIDRIKQELGKKEGEVYLLNAARLVHQKANDDVIKALALLPPNVYLILIGAGPDEKMLRKLASEKGVSERVKFIGQLKRDDVPKYRNRAVSDIFICPSRSEGLGNSFLSAMAARLPVIATQEGGLAEFIFDAKRNPDKPTTAWVVDRDSPNQIAEAVKDILANPDKVEKITETARQMVLEKYNWEVIAKEMRTKVFSKVL